MKKSILFAVFLLTIGGCHNPPRPSDNEVIRQLESDRYKFFQFSHSWLGWSLYLTDQNDVQCEGVGETPADAFRDCFKHKTKTVEIK